MAKKKTRRGIYNLCVLVIISMILYPPFRLKKAGLEADLGYSFIWDPPDAPLVSPEIHLVRLGLQIAIVVILGVVLARVLK